MRTTIVIKDELASKLSLLAKSRSLSEFINQCLEEHFAAQEKKRAAMELSKAYMRANENIPPDEFDDADREGWPEW